MLAESPAAEAEPAKVEQALTYMTSNPYIGWGLAGFALVVMATAAIALEQGKEEERSPLNRGRKRSDRP